MLLEKSGSDTTFPGATSAVGVDVLVEGATCNYSLAVKAATA